MPVILHVFVLWKHCTIWWSFMVTNSFGFVHWILVIRNCCGGFEKLSIPQADQSHPSPVTNFRFLWFTFCFVWNFCLQFRECALKFMVQYLSLLFLFVIYNILYILHTLDIILNRINLWGGGGQIIYLYYTISIVANSMRTVWFPGNACENIMKILVVNEKLYIHMYSFLYVIFQCCYCSMLPLFYYVLKYTILYRYIFCVTSCSSSHNFSYPFLGIILMHFYISVVVHNFCHWKP
jgi:hypothetical protein